MCPKHLTTKLEPPHLFLCHSIGAAASCSYGMEPSRAARESCSHSMCKQLLSQPHWMAVMDLKLIFQFFLTLTFFCSLIEGKLNLCRKHPPVHHQRWPQQQNCCRASAHWAAHLLKLYSLAAMRASAKEKDLHAEITSQSTTALVSRWREKNQSFPSLTWELMYYEEWTVNPHLTTSKSILRTHLLPSPLKRSSGWWQHMNTHITSVCVQGGPCRGAAP